MNHDIDDAIRIGLLKKEDLPTTYRDFLGESHGSRINALVMDIIDASEGICDVRQSPLGKAALDEMRSFLFENLYSLEMVHAEEEKGCHIIKSLFLYYMEHPEEIPESIPEGPLKIRVKDYVAGMTDKFASESYKDLFIPKDFHF